MGGNDSRYKVPSKLDAPIPFFAWEIVDIVVAMILMGVCILTNQILVGFVGVVIVLKIAKKLRQGQKQGQVQHLFWRTGINLDTPLKKHGPNPLILEYFE